MPEALCFQVVRCPSVHLKPKITLCPPVLGFAAPSNLLCPFFPSIHPSREVSGHFLENAWRELPQMLHADASWPHAKLIRLWSWSVDFLKFWCYFDIVKRIKFRVSRHFPGNAWREWPKILHAGFCLVLTWWKINYNCWEIFQDLIGQIE